MNLLVPYVPLPNHHDPLFEEYSYGDRDARARQLKRLTRGDYIFFHTTFRGKKVITAYFVVDRVLLTREAGEDPAIRAKYRNPHLLAYWETGRTLHEEDVIVFGDPITSRVLPRPLPFERPLAARLSLAIRYSSSRSEAAAIASATRAWRQLSQRDVKVLRTAAAHAQDSDTPLDGLRSSEEVGELIEKHLEDHLAKHPELFGKHLKLTGRQLPCKAGRIDLLFEGSPGDKLVVEVKLGMIGRDAIVQLDSYIHELQGNSRRRVKGALVCAGVMPAFESDIRKKRGITVYRYGWTMDILPW